MSGRSFFTKQLDTEERSDSESPVKSQDTELQTIFEFDELSDNQFDPSLHSSTNFESSSNSGQRNLPMGRLRREAPRRFFGGHQVEFPARFIEGFHDGHVGFNIPGIMQDSLKPTDSIEVKITLSTPDLYKPQRPDLFVETSQHCANPIQPCPNSNVVQTSRFGIPSLADDNNNNNEVEHHQQPYELQSELSYFSNRLNPILDSSITTHPNTTSLMPNNIITLTDTTTTTTTMITAATITTTTTSVDTNQFDSQVLLSTESNAISSTTYPSGRFRSLPICEEISMDSGLPSNFGQGLGSVTELGDQNEFVSLSNRFFNFSIH